MTVKCHYEILSIPMDADASTIKKAHRKLALKYHPDKNPNNHEEAVHQFRLIQSAYECLSDEKERKWYDEHREAILRGWDGSTSNEAHTKEGVVFDVVPFQFGGCYDGYGDNEGGFYDVYAKVFESLYEDEMKQWVGMGNIDESTFPNLHLNVSFGDSKSDFGEVVSVFYGCWESYCTICKFAWVDEYDVREAPNRRVRRAMEEENGKKRKGARKERNEEVLSLVRFVKRRDPRVKRRMEELQRDKTLRESQRKKDMERRKSEAAAAREKWREDAERQRREMEEEDLKEGKIRLADLETSSEEDDDSDYDFRASAKRGKKKKKKNRRKSQKKKKTQNKNTWLQQDEKEDDDDDEGQERVDNDDKKEKENETNTTKEEHNENSKANNIQRETLGTTTTTSSEEEEEPDVYRCEACKKDFKSQGQLKNHVSSKKHRESLKKYEKKLKLEQQQREEEEEERKRREEKIMEEDEEEEEESAEESEEEVDEAMTELLDELALESSNEEKQKDKDDDDDDDNDTSSSSSSSNDSLPAPTTTASRFSIHQYSSSEEESEEEEEEEEDVYKCVCCKKDFKSQGQLENHMKSKKHREAFQKFNRK